MGFRLKSGNTTSFKNMGGTEQSPAKDMKTGSYKQSFESPAKQRSTKGGEAQDQNKILDDKGNHIGNWVNDKKVMFNDKPAVDPDAPGTPGEPGYEPPVKRSDLDEKGKAIWDAHRAKAKKKKSPAKQTATTFADGSKKSARDKFNDTETAIEQRKTDLKDNQKSPYWYKINGKSATRAQYIKYQNKPGGDEPGKQTNDPDVYGRIKSNHGRGPKTK